MKLAGNMSQWKSKIIRKRGKGSQTPGKMKRESCQADGFKRTMAGRNRSWKYPEYTKWVAMVNSMNGIKVETH